MTMNSDEDGYTNNRNHPKTSEKHIKTATYWKPKNTNDWSIH